MPGGRPSNYIPEFAEDAEKLCRLGATDIELADFFGVERTTIWRWSQQHEEFCNALKAGKAAADERVERSLYAKATGYTFDSEKIMLHDGKVIRTPYREHIAPDTTAAIFWLKNRRPEKWRDRHEHDHRLNGTAASATDAALLSVALSGGGAVSVEKEGPVGPDGVVH